MELNIYVTSPYLAMRGRGRGRGRGRDGGRGTHSTYIPSHSVDSDSSTPAETSSPTPLSDVGTHPDHVSDDFVPPIHDGRKLIQWTRTGE